MSATEALKYLSNFTVRKDFERSGSVNPDESQSPCSLERFVSPTEQGETEEGLSAADP